MSDLIKFLLRFFEITSKYDLRDRWFWRTDGKYAPLRIWANVNDVFYWGCSDLEEITADNIEELERACVDADEAYKHGHIYAPILFAARQRKERPQGAYYNHIPKELHALLNEVGPEREIDFCNPKDQSGKYLYKEEAVESARS